MNWNIAQWAERARRLLTSRYVRLLEDEASRLREEIARLRLENRALLNSLLGTAGVPPVEEPRPAPQSIQPVRRRSWPQIAASRESQAAVQARARERDV